MEKDILDRLNEYSKQDYVPMHMPGAKRNTDLFQMCNPYGLDITEIDGFDNFHHAEGIIEAAFKRSARIFGAEETLFLVNGSSVGILAAICGATNKNDKILVARNCHQSVYNAIYLNELNPIYLYPDAYEDYQLNEANKENVTENFLQCANSGIYGKISCKQIEKALAEDPDIKVVVITSPTYEGIVSDICKIAKIVHRYQKVLIVDEAHGAHFHFSSDFPESAVTCGADAVIQSIHKTLPSFTQTALLHLNGNRIDRQKVKRYWNIYQTTSPSYLLLAGIDRCMTILEKDGKQLFEAYLVRLKALRTRLLGLKNMKLIHTDDISKIVLLVSDGKLLYNILVKTYHIQLEMAATSYVIAMTSIGDTNEYYERFANALIEIDQAWKCKMETTQQYQISHPEVVMNLYSAMNNSNGGKSIELVGINAAVGRVAAESVCFYPPGIPLVNPGERISTEVIEIIKVGIKQGLEVIGLEILDSCNQMNHQKMDDNTSNEKIRNEYIAIENIEKEIKIRCLK